jgi:hypothetical protein
MTHGDKAKAKAAKSSSQASAVKKANSKEAGGGSKVREGSKAPKIAVKGQQAAGEKGSSPAAPAKKGGSAGPAKEQGKARPQADAGAGGFSNPVIANAFKRALKKYPNALRKLTD